jgi:hypothetical protein
MKSSELLIELQSRIASGDLAIADVLDALDLPPEGRLKARGDSSSKLSTILYYLGGGIVFMGLVFLIGQQWHQFGSSMRVFITLGSAIAALASGVLLDSQRKLGSASSAFFLLSAMLLPAGLIVAFDEAGVQVSSIATQLQISGALAAVFTATFGLYRKNVLLIFAILFATGFFFTITDSLVALAPIFEPFRYNAYRVLLVGLSYMFLGHAMASTKHASLTGWLYGFGVVGFLGAGLALGEWKPQQNAFWELIYPGLVFGIIFLSTHLKSKTFLVFGSLALGSYLTKITVEYFADSLGWAFALVLVGLMLMGVAFLALQLQRKYVSS